MSTDETVKFFKPLSGILFMLFISLLTWQATSAMTTLKEHESRLTKVEQEYLENQQRFEQLIANDKELMQEVIKLHDELRKIH